MVGMENETPGAELEALTCEVCLVFFLGGGVLTEFAQNFWFAQNYLHRTIDCTWTQYINIKVLLSLNVFLGVFLVMKAIIV